MGPWSMDLVFPHEAALPWFAAETRDWTDQPLIGNLRWLSHPFLYAVRCLVIRLRELWRAFDFRSARYSRLKSQGSAAFWGRQDLFAVSRERGCNVWRHPRWPVPTG